MRATHGALLIEATGKMKCDGALLIEATRKMKCDTYISGVVMAHWTPVYKTTKHTFGHQWPHPMQLLPRAMWQCYLYNLR